MDSDDKKYYDDYNKWLMDCVQVHHSHVETIRKNRLSAAAEAIALCTQKQHCKRMEESVGSKRSLSCSPAKVNSSKKQKYETKSVTCRPTKVNLSEKVLGDLSFHSYIRMSATQFENLVSLVGAEMKKQNCVGKSIGIAESLLFTLKCLASGDSVCSVASQYSVDTKEAEVIITGTCTALWNKLVSIVMPSDLSKRRWFKVAQEFEEKWGFPHCVGAIDAVHVMIEEQDETTEIVLLAICDANFMFTFIDMGTYYGRKSDKDIFDDSQIGTAFKNGDMNLPKPSPLMKNGKNVGNFPYCLVGDKAFPLKAYLLKPYSEEDSIEISRLNFNCRLIRAQKTIETCLRILPSRWQVLSKTIDTTVENAMKVVQACVCLHNWLRLSDLNGDSSVQYMTSEPVDQKNDGLVAGTCRKNSEQSSAFRDINCFGSNGSHTVQQIRDKFLNYFDNEED